MSALSRFMNRQSLEGPISENPDPSSVSMRPFGAMKRVLNSFLNGTERQESLERVRSAEPVRRILVVCYGNICRSPVVELCLKRNLVCHDFEVRSCGLLPREGEPSPGEYAKEALRQGIDLGAHRSRYISDLLVDWADLIVIMDRKNLKMLEDFGPEALEKTVWLGAWDPEGVLEIADPFHRPPEEMRALIRQMKVTSLNFSLDLLRRVALPG